MLFLIFLLLAYVFVPPLFWGIVVCGVIFGILAGIGALCGAIADTWNG